MVFPKSVDFLFFPSTQHLKEGQTLSSSSTSASLLPDEVLGPRLVVPSSWFPLEGPLPFPVPIGFHPSRGGPRAAAEGDGFLRHGLEAVDKRDLQGEGSQ